MRISITVIALGCALYVNAQGPLSLSLQQALDLAAKQSYTVQNSALEAEKALHKVRDHGDRSAADQWRREYDQLSECSQTVDPEFLQCTRPGSRIHCGTVRSSVEYYSWPITEPIVVRWKLLGGIESVERAIGASRINLEKTEADARNQAAKAYYGVLAAQEGQRLAGESIPLLETAQREMQAMVEAGFMESTDVDRITIQLDQARTQQRNFVQQETVGRMLLALTLGTPQGTPITLTDDLRRIIDDANESAISEQDVAIGDHVELRIAENSRAFAEVELEERTGKSAAEAFWFLQITNKYGTDPNSIQEEHTLSTHQRSGVCD